MVFGVIMILSNFTVYNLFAVVANEIFSNPVLLTFNNKILFKSHELADRNNH